MRILFYLLVQLLMLRAAQAAAGNVQMWFAPTFGGKVIVLEDKYYHLPDGDSIMFETFRCYISDIAFYQNGKVVYKEPRSYHLLDAGDESTMTVAIELPAGKTYDKVVFHLGIDSATSTSGALSGDLDPGKGMFWTWQSGYINCKIEGRSNLCPTRHHEFQFHLGGYAAPDNALQEVVIATEQMSIVVDIPLDKFISGVDLRKQHSIMSPGPDAVLLSEKLAKALKVE